MKPERWRQVDRVFQEALERAPAERAAFIREACGHDDSLRREVEALLAADVQAEGFIEAPAFAVAAPLIVGRDAPSFIGKSIGRYQIISLVGKGGMGEVYRAEDTHLHRGVAIKVLPADIGKDPDRLHRFEREAQAASALNHPNIITIHEIGEAEGARYIVTEYVAGETLRQQLSRATQEKIELTEAVEMTLQIATALSAAHEAGITHRDIKPENVMVRPDGLVKVLDFGLAKLTERPAVTTETDSNAETVARLSTNPGVVMGTASYMSPEQARGQTVDHRTDIFSLGVMLYEMIAGRRPFEGATANDVIAALLAAEPPSLRSLNSQAPAELERITEKCLAKDREARYQSAKELIAELKPLRTGSQTEEAAERRRIEGAGTRLALWRWPVIVAIALTLIVGLAWFLFWRHAPAVLPDQIKSLAVLPLENLSGDPAEEYFADGMTDALIGDLAKIGALRVISRTSAMHYKGTKKSLPEIASELGVDAVVEGTVQRSGDRVLIRAQLIHAATDRHLWIETYERDLRDVLGLQSEVAQTIAGQIQIKITPAEQARLAHNRPVDQRAFDDYLQGRYLFWNKRTKENLEKAIEYFQTAIKDDPAYAQAYVGLADCYNQLGSVMHSALLPREAMRQAEEAARKALELDSELAGAHVALGFVKHYNWDWVAAEQEFKRAIELNPNYADAHIRYALYLVSRGGVEAALAEANRARELDPFSLDISASRGYVLENARRLPEAIEQLRRVIAMDPNHYSAHFFLGHTYAANGQFDEAITTSEKAAALSGRAPGALGVLGLVYGLAGRRDEANKVLNELLGLNRRRYVTPAALFHVYIGLGDRDQAFAWLEKAFQERSYIMAYLKVIPMVDPLRTDPRFDDLLRRMGLAP
jgi:TolB-like protein/Tfp pilus assembly protein PilF/predicted Ser/Thr protein kinase